MSRLIVVTVLGLVVAGSALAEPVTFRYVSLPGESAESVSLRGSMNGWGEAPFIRQDDGSWALTVELDPGEYQYKFFVNGQWPGDMESGLNGAPLDADAEDYVDDGYGGQNAVRRVGGTASVEPKSAMEPAPPLREDFARIHYHRPGGDYSGWGLHCWENTTEEVTWPSPLPPSGQDRFGLFWDVGLTAGAERVGFIVHKGEVKDPGPDMFLLPENHGREIWLVSGRTDLYTSAPDVSALGLGDLSRSRAHWVSRDTFLWNARLSEGDRVTLHAAPQGGLVLSPEGVTGGEAIALDPVSRGLSPDLRGRFPHLAGTRVFTLSDASDERVRDLVKGQLVLAVTGEDGKLKDATGIQIPGVLDDVFYHDGALGVVWEGDTPSLHLWAPTARSVRLRLDGPQAGVSVVDMTETRGVWSVTGQPDWNRRFYLYEVEVYVPETGAIEQNLVTDPYSRSLATNSRQSQIVNLADPELKPKGWNALAKPWLEAPEDIVLYELHVRDFSALDATVAEGYRGTFMAFTEDSDGTKHLRALAEAGLTHVHLLPSFDIATIDEDKTAWKSPGDLSGLGPAAEDQQAALAPIRDLDPYNWGYDPFHFGVPEGSYATDPEGAVRVFEFRRMVQALNDLGLRVVMDVVYNHTHASGQAEKSVLDRVVPGYYHRLNEDGRVETSTCCQNTATEHRMMEKLMLDDLVHWAVNYKIDGFRFDLMGHHMKRNMVRARDVLRALTLAEHGVDGSKIYLYGEGWDFGEVGQGARGENATQTNMAGTGVGTFNDRLRDAVRGGNPFGDRREQGFATGLFLSPNGFQGSGPGERQKLLEDTDRIRIGLAGNLKPYRFQGHRGRAIAGGAMNYGGYTKDPQETINYVSAHDNETLFDKIVLASSAESDVKARERMQILALSCVVLGQGIPFFHAGSDMLRSKSLDADSYNSGDWFNRLDFSYQSNNFGAGLPPAEKNADRWPLMQPLLQNPNFRPSPGDIRQCAGVFREFLAIRRSSPLFRLRDANHIQSRVKFHNTGPGQVPGLIVMSISDDSIGVGLDPQWRGLVVLINARPEPVRFAALEDLGGGYTLHPIQRESLDPAVRDAKFDSESREFTVPGRTTAVFVAD